MNVTKRQWIAGVAIIAGMALAVVAACLWRGIGPRARPAAASAPAELEEAELARLAQDFRRLAARYVEQGEKRKAHRAIGAAQELDRKIAERRKSRPNQPPR